MIMIRDMATLNALAETIDSSSNDATVQSPTDIRIVSSYGILTLTHVHR